MANEDSVLEIAIRANMSQMQTTLSAAAKNVEQFQGRIAALEAQFAASAAEADSLRGKIAALEAQMASTGHRTTAEFTEAKHAIAMVGEEIGVRVPRHLRGFIAGLPGVEKAMAMAFSGLAVLMIIQLVVEAGTKIKEFWESLHELSKAEQKMYDEALKSANESFTLKGKELRAEYELAIAKASGIDKDRLRLEEARALVRLGLEHVDAIEKQKKKLEDYIAAERTAQQLAQQRTSRAAGEGRSGAAGALASQITDVRAGGQVEGGEKKLKEISVALREAEADAKSFEAGSVNALHAFGKSSKEASDHVNELRVRMIGALAGMPNADAIRARILAMADPKDQDRILKSFEALKKTQADVAKLVVDNEKTMTDSVSKSGETQLAIEEKKNETVIADIKEQLAAFHKLTEAKAQAIDNEVSASQNQFERETANIEHLSQLGIIATNEKVNRLQKSLDKEYQAEHDALLRKLALYKLDPSMDAKELERVKGEIQKVEQKYALQSEKIQQQHTTRVQQLYTAMGQSIQSTMRGSVQGMIAGTQSLTGAIRNLGSNMLATMTESLLEMGLKWVQTHLLMGITSKIFHLNDAADATAAATTKAAIGASVNVGLVMSDAALAAANAYAFWAWNPPVAATMAATAGATVMAMAPAAAFEQGGIVPYDMPALVHAREMVLPRHISEGLQDMIGGGGSRGSRQITVQMPVSALDSKSFEGMIDKHSTMIVKTLKRKLKGVKL